MRSNMTYYERALIKKQNRIKEVRRNTILLLTAVTIVLFIQLIAITSFSSIASDDSRVVNYKYYKSIMVEKGDTLWSIAEANIDYSQYNSVNEYVKELRQMNSLKGESIKSGSYLIIPYFSTEFK